MQLTRPTILGFVAGTVLGMGDYLLLRALSVEMIVDGNDVTLLVVTLFALNFGALGAVIARLWERRRDLEKMQDELVEHERLAAVGRMSAGVAHEVRNPLSVIRSSAQMLAGGLRDEDAEAARFICEEVDRLDDFVGRILDFSRPLEAERRPIPWDDLRDRLEPVVGEGVEMRGDGQTFDVDTELTVRLLANLVDNARKAGDGVRVQVDAHDDHIDVVDDGPGIADEDREQIFEPFFTTRAKGTGLGLAMARKLARVQGWELEVVDGGLGEDGRGARFRFSSRDD